ncbi:hypothetical protein CYMTET_21689 [Cymbomonas tetramitiformis]|uniref:Uncharacterized protein n=1 Tax=Cymbomonas tetramitiformis TaxID=36881 RepID=A0AAE0G1P3_9CHLO|nr:hypothetical protein CYMTET_21689 [Cymbomonas tetramitiformis]
MLAREETLLPTLFQSVRRAITPLMDPVVMDVMGAVQEDIEGRTSTGAVAKAQRAARRQLRNAEESPALAPMPSSSEPHKVSAQATPDQQAVLASLDDRALLAELQRRRQRGRVGSVSDDASEPDLAKKVLVEDAARNDDEFEAELHDLQVNCTAEACVRPAKKSAGP